MLKKGIYVESENKDEEALQVIRAGIKCQESGFWTVNHHL